MALERIHATPGKLGARLRDRCALMPDPVDAPTVTRMADARRALCVPPDGRLIACTGMLDERKGVDLLVRAFARACQNNQLRADDRLLLAGLASARVRGILGGACAGLVRDGRIIVMDRFLSDEELALALAAPDVVCTPHPSHVGISSIALRALAAGRCVLASDFGWQGWFVERFGLGIACGVRSEEGFAASIGAALDAATDFTRTPTHDALLRFHSPENFRACWTRALRARMGLPVPPGLVSWEETVAACANQESHA
jgi:glycosyltransferase involved in cell wall biosynthesis